MGQVYALRCTHTQRIKFGWTGRDDATHRLLSCQTGSPTKLELLGSLPGTRGDELAIHHRLARYRLHGEWFIGCDVVEDAAGVLAGFVPQLTDGQVVHDILVAPKDRIAFAVASRKLAI